MGLALHYCPRPTTAPEATIQRAYPHAVLPLHEASKDGACIHAAAGSANYNARDPCTAAPTTAPMQQSDKQRVPGLYSTSAARHSSGAAALSPSSGGCGASQQHSSAASEQLASSPTNTAYPDFSAAVRTAGALSTLSNGTDGIAIATPSVSSSNHDPRDGELSSLGFGHWRDEPWGVPCDGEATQEEPDNTVQKQCARNRAAGGGDPIPAAGAGK